MQAPTRSTSAPSRSATDLRRTISRQTWLANRARNALRRPIFIGAISIGTFLTALVSMVVVPRTREASPAIAPFARPDTLSVLGNAALARIHLAQAESALAVARHAAAATQPPIDSSVGAIQRRDSIESRARQVEGLLARAEQAPLPSSYKALAELPELRSDPRIRPLVDSLSEVEREREGFGAVGGVDPIFVALTSRANEIGRAIQAVANEQLKAMRAEAAGPGAIVPAVAALLALDTAAHVAERDSVLQVIQQATDSLARLRTVARDLDLVEERARERASAVAPPLALLGSAFVLSAVIGFAAALFGELRRPRVSDANELERFLNVRVLSTVEAATPSVERGRRQADREAPPHFDPSAEGYQLAYLGLANEHPTLLTATVTGDDPAITAVVACNLAAVAAEEARSTLVIDLEPSCMASAALRARVEPGVVDILRGEASWPDARVAAPVGRDKAVDLVPFGVASTQPKGEDLIALLQQDSSRLARYYDAIFVLARAEVVGLGLASALPSPETVYCARPGITPLRDLREHLETMRAAGAVVRGVVLWNADRPLLPAPRELASKSRQKRISEPHEGVAAS